MKTVFWFIVSRIRPLWPAATVGLLVTIALWSLAIRYRDESPRERAEFTTALIAECLARRVTNLVDAIDTLHTLRTASQNVDEKEWATALEILGMPRFPEWELAAVTVEPPATSAKSNASYNTGSFFTFQHLTFQVRSPDSRKQIEEILSRLPEYLPRARRSSSLGFTIPVGERVVILKSVRGTRTGLERDHRTSSELASVFHDAPLVVAVINSKEILNVGLSQHKLNGTVRVSLAGNDLQPPVDLVCWSSKQSHPRITADPYRVSVFWHGLSMVLEYQPHELRADAFAEASPTVAILSGIILTVFACGFVSSFSRLRRGMTRIRRRFRALIDEHEKRYYTIFNTINDGVLILDHNWRIQECNPAAARILGHSVEDVIGKLLCDFCSEPCLKETDPSHCPKLQAANSVEVPAEIGVCRRIRQRSGDLRDVMFQMAALSTTGERKYVIALHDVTELNEANRRLEQTAQTLQAANVRLRAYSEEVENAARAKIAFLASMSHEIRTPLTAILGYAQLLTKMINAPETQRHKGPSEHLREEGEESTDHHVCASDPDHQDNSELTISKEQAVDGLLCNGQHLQEIINNILDFSKLESGRLEVEKLPYEPVPLVREVLAMLAIRARDKNLALTTEIVGRIPRTIQTDPTRLKQILINLVDNAIKFTSKGRVWVEIELDQSVRERPLLEFRVCDTGAGMSPDQIGRLFQPFRQANEKIYRQFGGTGLGLVISRQLARLLGGDIWVESTPGKGSVFHVRIATGDLRGVEMITAQDISVSQGPARKLSIPPSPMPARGFSSMPSSRGTSVVQLRGHILLAEDSPDNQRLIRYFLERAGAQVEIASDGREAIEKYSQRTKEGKAFDLILMDVEMPEIDGPQAVRRLRAEGCQTPILALTAHTDPVCVKQFLDAGYTGLIPKPVDREGLVEAVLAVLKPGISGMTTLQQPISQKWMNWGDYSEVLPSGSGDHS